MELLKRSGIPVKGRHCVIIGRGPTAGIPSILALLNRGDASVSCCHAGTPREVLLRLLDQAEIVVVALREPDLIAKNMVGRGVAVIAGGRITFDLCRLPCKPHRVAVERGRDGDRHAGAACFARGGIGLSRALSTSWGGARLRQPPVPTLTPSDWPVIE